MKKRKKNSLILLKHTFEMGFMMHVGPDLNASGPNILEKTEAWMVGAMRSGDSRCIFPCTPCLVGEILVITKVWE